MSNGGLDISKIAGGTGIIIALGMSTINLISEKSDSAVTAAQSAMTTAKDALSIAKTAVRTQQTILETKARQQQEIHALQVRQDNIRKVQDSMHERQDKITTSLELLKSRINELHSLSLKLPLEP